MGHGHHHHHHDHSHHGHESQAQTLSRLRVAFFLNLTFAVIELVGGLWANSLAVTSDALHDFGDALALGLALFLEKSSHQISDQKYTYGYRRLSVASAAASGFILLMGSFWILKESVERWSQPQAPHTTAMIGLALLGLSVNGYAAWKISAGHSLNEKMIRWHLIEDVLGWLIVLVGSLFMKFFDWPQVDVLLAVGLSAWVIYNVVRNLRHSLSVFLQAIPHGVNVDEIKKSLLQLEGIEDVHHTHLWSLDGVDHILTSHVRLKADADIARMENIKRNIKTHLKKFGIVEATIEFEWSADVCIDPHHHN